MIDYCLMFAVLVFAVAKYIRALHGYVLEIYLYRYSVFFRFFVVFFFR